MNKPVISLALTLVALAMTSCDKVKDVAREASSIVTKELKSKMAHASRVPVDNSLKQLVDQTEEGYLFRKDLPFPAQISLKTEVRRQISGRFYHANELGTRIESVNGTEVSISQIQVNGPEVRYILQESTFTMPSAEDPGDIKKVKNPLRPVDPPTDPITFRKVGNSWNSGGVAGFRSMVVARQLAPVFDELLVDNALAPRPLWFSSKRRLRIGEELDVAGSAVPMLVAGKASGSLRLKFEAVESVNGHPCGVFSVAGDYKRKSFPDFEGNLHDEEVTIESGRMWLSLIYPIILRQELNTIQTFKPAGDGDLVGRGQGVVKLNIIREWRAGGGAG